MSMSMSISGAVPTPERRFRLATQGPSWGYLKVTLSETLSTFGDKCPQNGSKNEEGIPPRRAFCGERDFTRQHL